MDNCKDVSVTRHKTMSKIKSKDTGIEIKLRNALWKRGYRYRKNYKGLPGKPDIVLTKYKIAIFCDSEFFHGKDWDESLHSQIKKGNNSEYWESKIQKNMQRDDQINKKLMYMGWTVLRFWGKDIEHNIDACLRTIEETIFNQKMSDTL